MGNSSGLSKLQLEGTPILKYRIEEFQSVKPAIFAPWWLHPSTGINKATVHQSPDKIGISIFGLIPRNLFMSRRK